MEVSQVAKRNDRRRNNKGSKVGAHVSAELEMVWNGEGQWCEGEGCKEAGKWDSREPGQLARPSNTMSVCSNRDKELKRSDWA